MSTPRIVFAGTPEFALASLSALFNAGRSVVAAYTQPDRPAGRGRRVSKSPVKRYCEEIRVPVVQPENFDDVAVVDELEALRPDIMIVAAYGIILPQSILDIPTHGCLNVHASLLPRWRGAAPIQAAILANDDTTGVSLMRMTAGLDCGPVFSTSSIVIGEWESAGGLHDRLAVAGADLLVDDLHKILSGDIAAVEQDESLATYAGKIRKKDANLDWDLSADELQNRVRAYDPVPGAFFMAQAKGAAEPVRVKVWRACAVADVDAEPGTFVQYDSDGIVVACGRDALRLEALQLPGRRRVEAHEFVAQIELL